MLAFARTRNHSLLVSLGALTAVVACSSQDKQPAPSADGTAQFALIKSDLPTCAPGQDGQVYYVLSDALSYVCNGSTKAWQASPCPACGGSTKWATADSLCLTGLAPKVKPGDGDLPDYNAAWGLQIGVKVGPVDARSDVGAAPEPTLEKAPGHKLYQKVTFTMSGTVTGAAKTLPTLRASIHRAGDPEKVSYCANMVSGTPIALISFNTECWGGAKPVLLTEADIPKIDKIGIQVSPDIDDDYTITDWCLKSIKFE